MATLIVMQLINQYSAFISLAIFVGLIAAALVLRHKQRSGQPWLMGFGLAASILVGVSLLLFRTGPTSSSAAAVHAQLAANDGQPLLIELFSDY